MKCKLVYLFCIFAFVLSACGDDDSPANNANNMSNNRADSGMDMASDMPGDMPGDMQGDAGVDMSMDMDMGMEPTAPPLDNSVTPSPWAILNHLLPAQPGYQDGSIERARIAYLAGRVVNHDGDPVVGAEVRAKGQDAVGWGETDAEGRFKFLFNGGGNVVFDVSADNHFPIQLHEKIEWGTFRELDDVVLTVPDSASTMVMAGGAAPATHTASMVSDDRGDRQVSLTFRAGTTADMVMPDGSTQALSAMTVRATEFTVGPNGPAAMPGPLEGGVAYTYAVELSVDEAMEAGAETVTFSQPVAVHLENFLEVPVGTIVPAATYSRSRSMWVPDQDGLTLGVVGVAGGLAQLDLDGDGAEDAGRYAAWGIDDVEREAIAARFAMGDSLTRVQQTSFSPKDLNFYRSVLDLDQFSTLPGRRYGTKTPRNAWERRAAALQEACRQNGSIIHCQNRALGEVVEIPGFGELYYNSDQVAGFVQDKQLEIPLLGATFPANLKEIRVRANVAGQLMEMTVPAGPSATAIINWDGRDGFGRELNGVHRADITLSYMIEVSYQVANCANCDPGSSFGTRPTGNGVTVSTVTSTFPVRATTQAYLGSWRTEHQGLGGWSIANHHSYHPSSFVLVKGDGEVVTTEGRQIMRVRGDTRPTLSLALPDGRFVMADSAELRINRPNEDPTVFTAPSPVNLLRKGPNGSLITATNNIDCTSGRCGYLRQMDPDGSWRLLAGNGEGCTVSSGCGIEESAVNSPLGEVIAAETAPDGSIYFIEIISPPSYRLVLRRLTADGRLQTVTSGVNDIDSGVQNISEVRLGVSQRADLAIAADGTVYFYVGEVNGNDVRNISGAGPSDTVWKFDASGQLSRVVGGTQPRGAGLGADETRIGLIQDIEITSDGELVVLNGALVNRGVFSVSNNTITDIAGDFANDSQICTDFEDRNRLLIGPNGTIYCYESAPGDWVHYRTLRGQKHEDIYRVPYPRDNALFEFDIDGRHLRTLNLLTGDERVAFSYDANGQLSGMNTEAGPVAIERDAEGNVTALVGLGDTRTTLTVTDDGLTNITGPMGRSHDFTYTPGNLLASYSDPAGRTNVFTYSDGLLVSDEAPDGGVQSLALQAVDDQVYDTVLTSAEGLETRYRVDLQGSLKTQVVSPAGAITEMSGFNSQFLTAADGTEYTTSTVPHQLYSSGPLFTSNASTRTPGGLEMNVSRTFNVALGDDPNATFPTNVDSMAIYTNQNGTKFSAIETTYFDDRIERSLRSAEFRQSTVTYGLDGRPTSTVFETLAPQTMTYDNNGWLQQIQQADQSVTFTRNAMGDILTLTDARGTVESWTYDLAGTQTSWTTGGNTYDYNHDAAGDLTEIVTPMGETFGFNYDAAGRRNQISVPNIGNFNWAFDRDGKQTSYTLPGGAVVTDSYDTGGRHNGWSYPEGDVAITYRGTTEDPETLTRTPQTGAADTISLEYDGYLTTRKSTSGAAVSDFVFTYNNDLQVSSYTRQVDASTPETITIARDNDGTITQLGDLQIAYPAGSSLPSTLVIGDLTQATLFDTLGRVENQDFTVGTTQFTHDFTYDSAGRVVQRVETLGVSTTVLQYTYDDQDQLLTVVEDPSGAATTLESYQYDDDGNRTSSHRGAATYNGHVLTNLEGTAVTTDANGNFASFGSLQLTYSARQELLSTTDGGTSVSYNYDALGRRVSASDGTDTWTYYYGNLARLYEVSAVREPDGTVVWYDYAPDGRLMGLKIGAERYEVISDALGSPRMVFNQGAVVKELNYDSFGVVLSDSDPTFHVAVGFAGGLNDPFTQLQRFWNRDYLPQAGRWTSLDPAFFNGDKRNLYLYVENNPVSNRDPMGLWCVGASGYALVGVGAKYCRKKDPKTGETKSSICFEVGVGAGGGLEISPTAGTDPMGENALVSGTLAVGAVSMGYELKLTNCGDLEKKKSASLGPFTHEKVKKTYGENGSDTKLTPGEIETKMKLKGELKVATEFCEEL